jgi:hypothetical protein
VVEKYEVVAETMYIYQNINDQSKIMFLSKQTHKIKTDSNGKQLKVKLDEDLLSFEYIEAAEIKYLEHQSKLGKKLDIKRSEFERLVKQKMFVRC